jgi:AcrR family transcriptional regulator
MVKWSGRTRDPQEEAIRPMTSTAQGTEPSGETTRKTSPTRRERQRQATFDEIVEVARRLLREGQDVSIRAVATEMGLTAPALYRYVDSHAELMSLVVRAIFADVVAAMTVARDRHADDDPAAQIVAGVGAFRAWALGNREEFRLVFASPPMPEDEAAAHLPLMSLGNCPPGEMAAREFGTFFADIFGRLWAKYHFPVPADDALPEGVLEALIGEPVQGFEEKLATSPQASGAPVSPGMLWLFERAWAKLYGTVTLEVFGHVHPALITTNALFEATVLDIGSDLGLAGEWERLQGVVREAGALPSA